MKVKHVGTRFLRNLEGMRGKAQRPAHASERRNPSLLTPEPPQERINYRAHVLIVLNSEKNRVISASGILEDPCNQTSPNS